MARLSLAAAVLFAVSLGNTAGAQTRPAVVELFTSQGCSSCPPADALLGELARRSDVLALGFHISYWDGLGWKDPFSSQDATERQRAYARRFGHGQVYTPQMVIEGHEDVVGSDRDAVLKALRQARPQALAAVGFAEDRRSVAIGGGQGSGNVLLLRYAGHRVTRVGAGENARRTLEDANAVEALRVLGRWDGSPRQFTIEPPGAGEGLAVLVQAEDGRILGAADARTAP
jgi:hypothetical protein